MKHISLIVCFVFILVLFLPVKMNQNSMVTSDNLKNDYNEAIGNASDTAAKALLTPSDNDSIELQADSRKDDFQKTNINLKEGLSAFYKSIYINLGIQNNYSEQQALLNKIPLIIATGYDGYFIHTWQEQKDNDGKLKVTNDWTPKKLYSIWDNKYNIKILYTLGDYVYIKDLNSKQNYEGDRKNFSTKYPEYFGDNFEQVKSQVINQLIQADLKYYTYNNNNIAKRNGWRLTFNVPYWGDRSISTISFIAFIQGKLVTGTENYNTYGFGAAKLAERKLIYGYEVNGHKYYSRENDIGTNIKAFFNEYEAANNGYSPDPKCK